MTVEEIITAGNPVAEAITMGRLAGVTIGRELEGI